MSPLRITHIASKDLPVPPIRGGAVQLWIEKVGRQLAKEHSVQIVAPWDPDQPEHETDAKLTYDRIRFGKAYTRVFRKILGVDPYGYAQRIARAASDFRPDIVHIHGGGSQWLPTLKKHLPHTPIVVHLHNDPSLELHKWRYRDWNHQVSFAACSAFIRDASIAALDLPTERCAVVHNGVDVADYTPWWEAGEPRRAMRARYGIPPDARVLLFCGRVAPEKGPQHLAVAAASLMADRPDLWVVFAGDYRDQPNAAKPEWYDTYQEIRTRLAFVWDRVVFTGPHPPAEMPAIYLLGDLFVAPSTGPEGFGMVFVEAMAAGLPVVGTKRGGIPEIICSETGALVDTPKELEISLASLIDDRQRLLSMGYQAREMAVKKFSWSCVANNIVALYFQITSSQ
jgi:spore coat protein SA